MISDYSAWDKTASPAAALDFARARGFDRYNADIDMRYYGEAMASDDLARRVADELEIRNLIVKIAMEADTAEDLTVYGSLFAEDAHWEVVADEGQKAAFAPATGRKNILAAALQRRKDRLSGPGTHCYHNLVMSQVTLQGDRASATSNLAYITNANTKPSIEIFKIYKDQFIRETDGWKLRSRYILPG